MAEPDPWRPRLARAGAGIARVCDIALALSLWVGATLVGALGCVTLVVIAVAGGRPHVFFLQLQNLSAHYLAADAARQVRFHQQAAAFYIAIALLLVIARLPALLGALKPRGGRPS